MPKLNTLQDVYIDGLRDIYNAETQLVKALPRISKSVTSDELRSAIDDHFRETEGHVERIEQVFEMLGMKVRGKKCVAMEGTLEEGKELISMDIDENAFDAAIIGAAQKVEHYEIASYGTLKSWATQLGFEDQADLLDETLSEEKAANDKLTQIAETIVNLEAQRGESAFATDSSTFSHNGKRR
jgi:ferritin-like metal-binding protein YciE